MPCTIAERVLVACGDSAVAAGTDLPSGTFTRWELDGPPAWIGPLHLATETSWYSTKLAGVRVGAQAALVSGETVFGHASSATRGYRVTRHGVAVSPLP